MKNRTMLYLLFFQVIALTLLFPYTPKGEQFMERFFPQSNLREEELIPTPSPTPTPTPSPTPTPVPLTSSRNWSRRRESARSFRAITIWCQSARKMTSFPTNFLPASLSSACP